jgi:hypothetical protein
MENVTQIEPNEYYFETTQDILIEVFPHYVPERSMPESNQYFYAYKIKITNVKSLVALFIATGKLKTETEKLTTFRAQELWASSQCLTRANITNTQVFVPFTLPMAICAENTR